MKRCSVAFVFGAFLLCVPRTQSAKGEDRAKVLIPHSAWNCGMQEGIPNPEYGSLLFEVEMKLDRVFDVGKTPYGNRRIAVGQSGILSVSKLPASVMPGALDLELTLANGTIEIEQIFVLKTADEKYIYVRTAGTGADARDTRIVLDFEAPSASAYAWVNSGKYVARRVLNATARTITMQVYDVSGVALNTDPANITRIAKPAGVPAQPWDYRKKAPIEKQAKEVIVEKVTLSPSQAVGASKHGNRNIIPITGGELSGQISGKVLFGGADYQNLSPPATIDARYLWETSDGEIVLVRNAGPFGSLVPTFETRTDGANEWLNTGSFLSSNPGMAADGVSITMYDSTN